MKTCIVLFVAFLFLFTPARASACSCASHTPCEAFSGASAVFIGRMMGGTEKVKDDSGKDTGLEAGKVRFVVEEVFKGSLGQEVQISVASMTGTSCGPYGLHRGQKYLVYAYGESNSDELSTGVCTRTTRLTDDAAKEDLEFLRNLPAVGSGGRLYGQVWADEKAGGATPLPGVTIVVTGEDKQTVRTITNDRGEFEFPPLKAGKYKVEPVWPENYTSENSSEEVTVADRGCARAYFEAEVNGRVTGRVFDSEQHPAKVSLRLVSANDKEKQRTVYGYSEEDGSFEVTGVPPGDYLLYMQLEAEEWKNNQNYYYPGTKNRKEATVIKVALGQKVEGHEFQLPAEYAVRTVEGQVTWPDGKPAAEVEVMLLCPKSSRPGGFRLDFMPPTTTTDEQGRFKLQAFKGETYCLEARGSLETTSHDEPSLVHSPSRTLPVKENLTGIKIVLSQPGFTSGCCNTLRQK
ncbi:MAG: hypothetical protein ICV60_00445 [Pyrinomonadaceae bacterium]|nr:hypothetical protein [Pyrinomonadaceae bacterium]